MKIEVIDIDLIKPYENNAKEHPREQIEQIKKSIQEFGNNDPIAIDEDKIIIEGHGRYIALKELGFKLVDCIILEGLTEDQKNAYRLVHNQLTMNSGWDMSKLKEELSHITLDMRDLGIDVSLLDQIEDEYKPVQEDEFNVDEALDNIEVPETKLGNVYQLGKHRLICGDSTNEETLNTLMGNEQANLFLTDPPYNVAYEGTAGTIENDDMEDKDFREFLRKAFEVANNHLKEGSTFYIWHADSEGYNFRGACHDIGWKVRQCLIWKKSSLVLGRQDYQWIHEPCLYGWKDGASHYFIDKRNLTTVLEFDKPRSNPDHPTMKPLELFGFLMKNSSKKGDIVLDPFGGSGTTLICAEQLDRACYMVELDPKYCDVIIKRWEALTGETAHLIKD